MLELVLRPDACRRDRFDPGHFTASAFVLAPERDAILLIFHRKLGIWVQPGGHVDEGDLSVRAAAEREVAEEVGIRGLELAASEEALFDVDIHPIPARPGEPAHEHFDVRFSFVAPSRRFVASDEVAAARWVSLSEVGTVASDESVQRAVRKLRG